MNNVTEKTNQLVLLWIAAQRRLARAKAEINAAESELANSANALGRWLCAEEVKPEEVFNIWFGSGILQVHRKGESNDYECSWRKEPDGKDRLKMGF